MILFVSLDLPSSSENSLSPTISSSNVSFVSSKLRFESDSFPSLSSMDCKAFAGFAFFFRARCLVARKTPRRLPLNFNYPISGKNPLSCADTVKPEIKSLFYWKEVYWIISLTEKYVANSCFADFSGLAVTKPDKLADQIIGHYVLQWHVKIFSQRRSPQVFQVIVLEKSKVIIFISSMIKS